MHSSHRRIGADRPIHATFVGEWVPWGNAVQPRATAADGAQAGGGTDVMIPSASSAAGRSAEPQWSCRHVPESPGHRTVDPGGGAPPSGADAPRPHGSYGCPDQSERGTGPGSRSCPGPGGVSRETPCSPPADPRSWRAYRGGVFHSRAADPWRALAGREPRDRSRADGQRSVTGCPGAGPGEMDLERAMYPGGSPSGRALDA